MPASTFFLAIFIIITVFGPFAVIWALNTMFPVLAIPYDFWTWLAVNIMHAFAKSSITVNTRERNGKH